MSQSDIEGGQRWSNEIAKRLQSSDIGVICVTPENQKEPWLNFEAGAIAKAVDSEVNRVITYAIEMAPEDIEYPLGQFQGLTADQTGSFKVVRSMNDALVEGRLSNTALQKQFDRTWEELAKVLKNIPSPDEEPPPARSDQDKQDEILAAVRALRASQDETRPSASIIRLLESQANRENLLLSRESVRKMFEEYKRFGKSMEYAVGMVFGNVRAHDMDDPMIVALAEEVWSQE